MTHDREDTVRNRYGPDDEPEAPGSQHGETHVDPHGDTTHGTGAAPKNVDDDDVDEDV